MTAEFPCRMAQATIDETRKPANHRAADDDLCDEDVRAFWELSESAELFRAGTPCPNACAASVPRTMSTMRFVVAVPTEEPNDVLSP